MTIWETGIATGVMLLLLAGYLATQSETRDADEARLRATAIERLHAGVEEYLRNDYAFLEQCLNGPLLEEEWNLEDAGGQAGPFKAVRLYPTPIAEMPADDHAQALAGTHGDLNCDNPALGAPRSLSETGFLPAMLAGRRYDTADAHDSSNLWRGLDFRLLIRMVNLTREPSNLRATPPIAAHVGLQAVLAMQARSGEAMSERDAGAVLRAMTIGEGGIVRSVDVGDTTAEQTIAGRNGGWRMELCSNLGVAGLNACELPFEFQRIDVPNPGSPERRAFIGDTGDPTARLVTVTSVGREEGLREVLHRADIGIPEANRMETDIDVGGYGLLNVAYVTGIDEDGDGLIDRGVGLIGPQRDTDPETDGKRAHPVTVYGDLHVRGAIHVGEGVDADGDGVASEFDTNIPEGTLWAQGGIQVGEALDGDDDPMGFDEELPNGTVLVPRGLQVGGSRFGIRLDDLETPDVDGARDGAIWARGGVQLGDVIVYGTDGEPVLDSPHDPNVSAGGLLVTGGRISETMDEDSVGEIRSSGGLRVVGPEIVLAASNSPVPSRAGPRRGWDAVASGLGDILDAELTATDTYTQGDGGRIQLRSEGDELRMVTNSGSLRVTPREHEVGGETLQSVQLSAQLWGSLSGPVLGDAERADAGWLVMNSEDILVKEVAGGRSLKSRTLHSALPQYVSKRFHWNQDWVEDSGAPGGWRMANDVLDEEVLCPDNGDRHDVLIPVSWSRTDFARTATFHVNLQKWVIPLPPIIIPTPFGIPIIIPRFKVIWAPLPDAFMGSGGSAIPGAFTLNHPYLGWSMDPETGEDNTVEVPSETVGFVDSSRNVYCDYSLAPLERPSAGFDLSPGGG